MANRDSLAPSFSPARRFGIGLSVATSVVAATALLLMVNFLAFRHSHRFQWGGDQRFQLCTATRQVLEALTNEVRTTILFDRNHALFSSVSGLLKEYAYACPRLSVRHVDYSRDIQMAQTIIDRLQLPPTESDLVVFESGGRSRVVRAAELSDYDVTRLLAGDKEIPRVGFKGEPLFTSALAGLIESRSPVVYCLQGHGEHDPMSTESKFGYSRFARLLEQKNITLKPLRLTGESEVPEDCRLLIVAGPRSRLDPAELDRLQRYLSRGGRLLALLSYYQSGRAPTGLERLLDGWGVAVGENLTFDIQNAVPGGGILATNFSAHPVMRPLRNHTVYVVMARSIEPKAGPAGADAPRVEALFSTSPQGFTASEATDAGLPRHNPAQDRRGVIALAVAVEKGNLQGVAADRGSTRIVVVGESIFLANETIVKTAANLEFASLSVNWLLDRPQSLGGIAPRPIPEFQIMLSRRDLVQVRWLLLAGLPAAPLAVGLLVWIRRRR